MKGLQNCETETELLRHVWQANVLPQPNTGVMLTELVKYKTLLKLQKR